MNEIDRAIEILRLSDDGERLSPGDLAIVQAAVRNRLTEEGHRVLEQVYGQLTAGAYVPENLCGVPHLTRDLQGYVYYKGVHVEHFSHTSEADMRDASLKLAERCRLLESKGFPVNSRTAVCPVMREAPAGTPWLEALSRYYTFFEKDGNVRPIFYRYVDNPPAVALEKRNDVVESATYPSAYAAYHATAAMGYTSVGVGLGYVQIVGLLERTKLTPEDIHAALH